MVLHSRGCGRVARRRILSSEDSPVEPRGGVPGGSSLFVCSHGVPVGRDIPRTRLFDERGVQFRYLTESIDTSTPGGTLVFNIFGSLAQFERDLICERTRARLDATRACGRKGVRPTKLDDSLVEAN